MQKLLSTVQKYYTSNKKAFDMRKAAAIAEAEHDLGFTLTDKSKKKIEAYFDLMLDEGFMPESKDLESLIESSGKRLGVEDVK